MHQVAVMIWMPVSVLFEWILLDGLFDIEFISKVPDGGGKLHSKLIHWEDYLLSKHPSACLVVTRVSISRASRPLLPREVSKAARSDPQ